MELFQKEDYFKKRKLQRGSYKTGKKEGDRFPKAGDLVLLYHVLLRLEKYLPKITCPDVIENILTSISHWLLGKSSMGDSDIPKY